MLREYDLLGPLEGVSGLIIGLDKGVDLIAHLAWRGEARAGQGFGGENGEPYLHLIEPGGMGRRKMEMDVLVPRQPAVVFGLVGIEIVQNHMDLPAGMIGNQAVHEIQELDATAALIMAGLDQASGNIEGGEQGRGAVTFVCMAEPCHRFAIGQLQPALGALQSLDVRLLVDRKHHRVLGRLQVEPDNVGSLLRKRRIGADTPTAPPRQRDLMPAQNPPDLMFGDVAQMPGQQAAVPAPVPPRDGYREDRFAADHLKKIKEVENNGAVVGPSAMWRYYLTNRTSGDMLAREYPFLKFGAAAEYAVEQGVPDKLWRSHEPRQRSTLFDEDPSD
jgi:hypothetical protein